MDFPVEATVHLNSFPDKNKVRQILCSNGFKLKEMGRDQVRVKGSFLKLKAVKASLEQFLQSKPDVAPSSPSRALKVSSGAIPKHYANAHGTTGRSGSPKKSPHASPSSPTIMSPFASGSNRPISPEHRNSFSPRPDRGGSFRPGKESFLVDADVFLYAEQLRKRDIDCILEGHNVKMQAEEDTEDSCTITLMGKSARIAVGKLQSLLDDLGKSLRTQEVPLRDLDHEGRDLLERIRKHKNIFDSVLVREKSDRLHLVGGSGESYSLKQRLLRKSSDQSGRTGRTLDRNSRGRSSSLPPISRRNTEIERGANANQSPAGAAGYSPSKYQDDEQKHVGTERAAATHSGSGGSSRRRSQSESRKKPKPEKTNGPLQERANNRTPAKLPKTLKQLLTAKTEDIKQKFKSSLSIRKKK
nr:uncharacterized protein LOC109975818 [Labrus bergylta]